ncbi:hypothetical protein GOBAR_AA02958 [Gossypium barbadense]|uniref:Zinc knuckle CX2CX4HX4C domain-containing protein n=1 Tax=Gossypium barbadense TaxID=3634 RepID=A0A2P5YPT7_GOSBA|nr:hypothetical protein GOBAR_AA02958 [Gossypium barbadense]
MEDKLANLALLDGKEEAFQEEGEFWVQIPDLPPGLMLEVMARQFGSFLSSFLDYDTKISLFAVKQFMRIKVHLDVRVPLKKIVLGASRMVYARFQHEKLSMFCFLHGKLGHGESFCPLKVRIDSAKILFGWNISLYVSVRRGSSMVSRWLRETDGTISQRVDKEMSLMGNNFGDNVTNIYPNRNQNLVGSTRYQLVEANVGVSHWENDSKVDRYSDSGLMELGSNGEECPIQFVEGQKIQKVLEEIST